MNLLKTFVAKHIIVEIGIPLCGDPFGEIIVDEPYHFIRLVMHSDCYISCIRWWDRANIQLGSKIGYGGPRDPRSPKDFFFAETDIYQEFSMDTAVTKYCEYLDSVRSNFAEFDLFPAFEIQLRTINTVK